MRIIELGKIPPKVKTIRCLKCNSLLEYAPKDVKTCTDGRDDFTEYWVDCPLCKEQISLNHTQSFN